MLLHDKLKPYRLILASQSPRRQQLLAESGLPYEPAPRYDCQEVYPATLAATQVPRYLSQLKSRAYPRPLAENEILLTADTVVIWKARVPSLYPRMTRQHRQEFSANLQKMQRPLS